MAANKRTKGQREADNETIARLYLQSKTLREIAEAVNQGRPEEQHIGPRQVSNSLAGIRAAWLDNAAQDYDAHVSRELARVDEIEREAWEAWERSKRQARTVRTKTTAALPQPEGQALGAPAVETTETLADQAGDPRFLDKVGWCIEQRVKILGLAAPDVSILTGMGEGGAVRFTLDLGEKKLEAEQPGASGGASG